MIKLHVSDFLGRKKMTQKELSDATGIRPGTISAMYHETIKSLSLEQIDKLCEVFNCDPGELITRTKPSNEIELDWTKEK